jgi:hypothetical protein
MKSMKVIFMMMFLPLISYSNVDGTTPKSVVQIKCSPEFSNQSIKAGAGGHQREDLGTQPCQLKLGKHKIEGFSAKVIMGEARGLGVSINDIKWSTHLECQIPEDIYNLESFQNAVEGEVLTGKISFFGVIVLGMSQINLENRNKTIKCHQSEISSAISGSVGRKIDHFEFIFDE